MPLDLDALQRAAFDYFVEHADPRTGLVSDNSGAPAMASIACSGYLLSALAVGTERGWIARADAVARIRAAVDFLSHAEGRAEIRRVGHRGFYYHFLDRTTGRRRGRCELSTIDTAIVHAGLLFAAEYFDGHSSDEVALRAECVELYAAADWRWALNDGTTVSHGWRPERGFIRHRWSGYSEAFLLYVLALGSPTHPLPRGAYDATTHGYRWRGTPDGELLEAGPLFIHQVPQLWLDLRDVQDDATAERGTTYWENTRRATLDQRRHAIDNPGGWTGYDGRTWGVTASDGPGPARRRLAGRRREFWEYRSRGVRPDGDDGTIAPWATLASLPYAPELVRQSLEATVARYPEAYGPAGCLRSINPTFGRWASRRDFGIDQGPVVLAIENFRSGLVWRTMRRSPYVRAGLERAGFRGGWLSADRAREVAAD